MYKTNRFELQILGCVCSQRANQSPLHVRIEDGVAHPSGFVDNRGRVAPRDRSDVAAGGDVRLFGETRVDAR